MFILADKDYIYFVFLCDLDDSKKIYKIIYKEF